MKAATVVAVCNTLTRAAGQGDLWTDAGPNPRALAVLHGRAGVTTAQALLVRVAFDVFNGQGNADMGRIIGALDAQNLRLVGSLLVVLASRSDSAALAWVTAHGPAVNAGKAGGS